MPINTTLMASLKEQYGEKKGEVVYWGMYQTGKVSGDKPKTHVKSYYRKKHGRADFGGQVHDHFRTLTGVVEMSQGEFKKKPKLIIKPWAYATNHLQETNGKTTQASVIIDKKAMKDDKLAKFLMLHELRENQNMQTGMYEPEAHALATSFENADTTALNLGDPYARTAKVYNGSPEIFTDKQLNSLSDAQMFSKSGRAITPEMNAIRAGNTLKRYIRHDGEVMTWKEFVDKHSAGKVSEAQVPSVHATNRRLNRMSQAEQDEFYRKAAIKKTEYRVYTSDDSFVDVPKFVYLYAKETGK